LRKVLYDTNIILDVLLERRPHYASSVSALDLVGRGEVEGYVAAHSVATLAYLLDRQLGRGRGKEVLTDLLSKLRVAPVTDAVVRRALAGPFAAFEDGLCHDAAAEAGVMLIVTRNVRDFRKGTIRAVLPVALRPE
jgi:predicted nucleic acid-binding protein